jgi:hypothetical protein
MRPLAFQGSARERQTERNTNSPTTPHGTELQAIALQGVMLCALPPTGSAGHPTLRISGFLHICVVDCFVFCKLGEKERKT